MNNFNDNLWIFKKQLFIPVKSTEIKSKEKMLKNYTNNMFKGFKIPEYQNSDDSLSCSHYENLKVTYYDLSLLATTLNNITINLKTKIESEVKNAQCIQNNNNSISVCSYTVLPSAVTQQTNCSSLRFLLVSLSKFFSACTWITKKCLFTLFQILIFTSVDASLTVGHNHLFQFYANTKTQTNDVSFQVAEVKRNYDFLTSDFNERFRRVQEDLIQMRIRSEFEVKDLNEKLQNVLNYNNRLIEENIELKLEVKAVKAELVSLKSSSTKILAPQPLSFVPPPPPPPPPLLPFNNNNKVLVNQNKPKSEPEKKKNQNEPRGLSITPEDLQKVTLKKTSKEKPKPQHIGLEISEEMIRTVKLRSTKSLAAEEMRSPSR